MSEQTAESIFDRLPKPVYVTYFGEGEFVAQLANGQSVHAFGGSVVEALSKLEEKLNAKNM